MKVILLSTSLAFCNACFSQSQSAIARIDSLVQKNLGKVTTIFQNTEPNPIYSTHGKNPDYQSYIYRFASDKSLLSMDVLFFSIGDTSIMIKFHFASNQLIKATGTFSEFDTTKTTDIFYFDNDGLINKNTEIKGPYFPDYYLRQAKMILQKTKKKPIRFPI